MLSMVAGYREDFQRTDRVLHLICLICKNQINKNSSGKPVTNVTYPAYHISNLMCVPRNIFIDKITSLISWYIFINQNNNYICT